MNLQFISIFPCRLAALLILIFLLPMRLLTASEPISLEQGFVDPPLDARPRGFWWRFNSQATRESITRDLEKLSA